VVTPAKEAKFKSAPDLGPFPSDELLVKDWMDDAVVALNGAGYKEIVASRQAADASSQRNASLYSTLYKSTKDVARIKNIVTAHKAGSDGKGAWDAIKAYMATDRVRDKVGTRAESLLSSMRHVKGTDPHATIKKYEDLEKLMADSNIGLADKAKRTKLLRVFEGEEEVVAKVRDKIDSNKLRTYDGVSKELCRLFDLAQYPKGDGDSDVGVDGVDGVLVRRTHDSGGRDNKRQRTDADTSAGKSDGAYSEYRIRVPTDLFSALPPYLKSAVSATNGIDWAEFAKKAEKLANNGKQEKTDKQSKGQHGGGKGTSKKGGKR